MIFTLTDLETLITPSRLEEAWYLFRHGHIPVPNIQRGGELITNIIPNSRGRSLRIYVRIAKQKDNILIHGECTCGESENCEHVAGTLLQALASRQELPGTEETMLTVAPGKQRPRTPAKTTAPLPSTRQTLLYILHLDEGDLLVETCVVRRLKNSSYTVSGYFLPSRATTRTPPRYLEPVDLELLAILDRSPHQRKSGEILLSSANSASLLEAMLATGRCYFEHAESSTLISQGEPRPCELQWIADDFGRQHIHWQTTPQADHILPLPSPRYLDTRLGLCGPLENDLPENLLHGLLTHPPVLPDEVDTLHASWREAYPDTKIPPLQRFETETLPKVKPVPCLRLTTLEDKEFGVWDEFFDLAYLSFDYNGIQIDRFTPSVRLQDGRLIQVQRNKRAEQSATKLLRTLGLEEDEVWREETGKDCFIPALNLDEAYSEVDDWLNFQTKALPNLRTRGWRIDYDDFRYRLAEASNWVCDIASLERRDWFSIALGVEMDGRSIDLLPILLNFLDNFPKGLPKREEITTESFIVPVDDGQGEETLLCLPAREVLPLLETLLEIYDNTSLTDDQRLPCSRVQLARLTALQSEDAFRLAWLADDEIRQLAQRLSQLDGIPEVTPPKGLTANLRAYQQTGLNWLQFLREYRLAGILADDMGLGKTVQALAHLLLEKEAGRADRPSLVIAPTSLMFNWRHEAERFVPRLKVLVLHGANRKKSFASIGDQDLIITTYPLLARDKELLLKHAFHLLILDEAQVIKNPKAQASRVARELDARHRLCLTGTPLENHLGELWSLFDFLLPGLLGDSKQFRRFFRTPIEKQADTSASERLSRRLRPFLLRRTKQQVASELPEKTEIVQSVVLEGKQRELYETVRLSVHRRVRQEIERQGLARSHIVVLDALLKLRQVCCDPRLVKVDKARNIKQSAKLETLMEMLGEMVEEGRRILVFSQFTTMLGLIEEAVKAARIDYVKLTGQTRNRETPVQRFQTGEIPLFLISLKAGGVGLNLTAADTIIHYDPWWNPAVERQATDRAHRIGQKQAVFVYKLICEGTLEEKILAMQQRKQRLADDLYQDDGNQEPLWNEQDLEMLFGPLQE